MSNPESQTQDSIALDDVDSSEVEELARAVHEHEERIDQLAGRIAETQEDMVRPETVQRVLQEYGLSIEKAAEIVETVKAVNDSLRGGADE